MKDHLKQLLTALLIMCLSLPGFIIGSAADAEADTGLVAHYKFDGDLKDSSGKENNGSQEGSEIIFVDAKSGKGAKFDGASYITVEDNDSLDLEKDFSIAVWIYKEEPQGENNWSPVLAKGEEEIASENTPYALYYDCSGLRPCIRLNNLDLWEEIAVHELRISNQRWHHLAVTKSGTSVKFYVDGVLKSAQSCEAEILMASPGKLLIGANIADWNAFFKGIMDDLRIYNRALSNEEIKSIFTGEADASLPAAGAPAGGTTTAPGI